MKYEYIITAILLNTSPVGITPKVVKAAKADEDFAGFDVEHDEICVDDISVSEIVKVNERILAVTYYIELESELPQDDLNEQLDEAIKLNVPSDFIIINYSAVNSNL